jgi:multidrug transporter EmrE-like cation transporter
MPSKEFISGGVIMIRTVLNSGIAALSNRTGIVVIAFMLGNMSFNVLANTSFKFSVTNPSWRSFLAWQVIGNLAGFLSVLTLTGAMRFIPLHIAYPVSAGLSVIGVQVLGSRLILHEAISPQQWFGSALVVVGIALIGGR